MPILKSLKESRGDKTPLALWDVGFWAERLREQRFDYTDEQLRPYFPFEKVLDGLFRLMHRLFGVTVQPARRNRFPSGMTTSGSITSRDEAGNRSRRSYLDPYSRPENKRGGAWMDNCLGRRRLPDGRLQLPVAHLVCNQTPPIGDKPSLMSFREVETLFHEMGHGLQHMLTTRRARRRRGHSRRGMGRRRIAEPVHGELVLSPADAAGHDGPLSDRRTVAGRTLRQDLRLADLSGRLA